MMDSSLVGEGLNSSTDIAKLMEIHQINNTPVPSAEGRVMKRLLHDFLRFIYLADCTCLYRSVGNIMAVNYK